MRQFQARWFAIIVLSWILIGCAGISTHPSTNNNQPGDNGAPPSTNPQGATFVAANFPGADCGAKIQAADKAATQNGVIEVTPACGTTWSTPVVVGQTHTLLLENGTYQIAHTVLLHDGACVQGQSATLAITKPIDIISNADASNSNLCVKTITLSGAQLTGGLSRGIYFKNVHNFTIDSIDLESMVTHGVFIDDGSESGQITNNTCNNVIQGSCFLAGNAPGLAEVTNMNISNNTISNVHAANGVFVIGSKNGQPTSHITINNNVLRCVRDTSIEIGDGAQFVTASGNQITPCVTGSTGIIVRSAQHITVENNTSSPAAVAANMLGIFVWNKGGDSEPFDDVTINQNTITGYAGTSSAGISWSSFAPNSSNLSITNNIATGNTNNFFARTNNIINLVFTGNSSPTFQ
ncbi:MAG TPA: right-handed parallel beta-helix repeat-containing protein [Candidatus Angelobacter sp.]|nr:right-handed parallel beta-helix repeat-containing protein [Candidatus Angelobacter sp.]